MDWLSLNPTLAGCLTDVIQAPRLQSLDLNVLDNFPFYSLKKATHLSTLSINYVTAGEDPEVHQAGQTDERRNGSSPSVLDSSCNDKSMSNAVVPAVVEESGDGLHRDLDFSHLKHLSFTWDFDNDIDDIKALMHSVLNIETLHIIVEYDDPFSLEGLAEMVLHGSFRTLRNLEFTVTCREQDTYQDPFGNIGEELKQLSTRSSCLESIVLILNLQGAWAELGGYKFSTACDVIDNLFASRVPFPHLQTLAVIARYRTRGDDYDEEGEGMMDGLFYQTVKEMQESYFPNLSTISTINFSFEVTHIWT